jgi:regulator of sigma D
MKQEILRQQIKNYSNDNFLELDELLKENQQEIEDEFDLEDELELEIQDYLLDMQMHYIKILTF